MRRIFLVLFSVLIVLAFAGCKSAKSDTSEDNGEMKIVVKPVDPSTIKIEESQQLSSAHVSIAGFAFSPSSVTVKKGQTVVWTNKDSMAHTATSSSGLFDSKNLNNGESFSFKFDNAGEYDYFCNIHTSMKGKVIVE